MERISGNPPLIIDFDKLQLGETRSGPKLFSEIEGRLVIRLNDRLIFSEEKILLLEFAKYLSDWLDTPDNEFSYYSMDYEDGPILAFSDHNSEKWRIHGVWINEKKPLYVEGACLVHACRSFIENLVSQLGPTVDLLGLL